MSQYIRVFLNCICPFLTLWMTKSPSASRSVEMVIIKHISVMELGHLLTRSGLTYPEVSSKVCRNSFCQLGNSFSLPWVIYYEAFYLHVVSSYVGLVSLNYFRYQQEPTFSKGAPLRRHFSMVSQRDNSCKWLKFQLRVNLILFTERECYALASYIPRLFSEA